LTAFLGFFKRSPKSLKANNVNYGRRIKLSNVRKYSSAPFYITKCGGKRRGDKEHKRFYSVDCRSRDFNVSDKDSGLAIILSKLNIKYEAIYTNLHIKENRDKMSNDLRNKQGIYMIFNLVTENYYIGSASTNRFMSRFTKHLISLIGSKVVKNSVLKYGLSNFAFIILEYYPDPINRDNNKLLLQLEDKYLKTLLPNYNILTEAGNSFGYKHSEEIKKKMSDIYSDERREFIRNLNLNKNLSIETSPAGLVPDGVRPEGTRKKLSEQALKRPPMSNETKLKCIANERSVYLYDKGNYLYFCPNIKLAALLLHCSYKTLQRALKEGQIYSDPKLIDYISKNKDLSINELLLSMGIYPYIKDSDNKDLVSKLYDFEKNKQNFRKSTNRNLKTLSCITIN
jgi:group I intron endonuclease